MLLLGNMSNREMMVCLASLLSIPGCLEGPDPSQGTPDAPPGQIDAASTDAGPLDSASPDAFVADASAPDGAVPAPDAGAPDATPTCGAAGGGTVTGSVGGVTIDPVARAYIVNQGGWDWLYLDETPGSCSDPPGENFRLIFLCPPITVGTWTTPTAPPNCAAGDHVAVGVINTSPMDLVESEGGSIVVATNDGTCVTGTFNLVMETGETLSGDFQAIRCP